ncbi:MAG: UDP-N-acetylglucosamine--LPS N-acetylglucosamine transferase [Methylobacter sp.]
MKKVLAVASAGGHWTEMMLLKEVFDGHDVVFVCTMEMYRSEVAPYRFYSIPGVSRLYKRLIVVSIAKLLFILVKEKPDVVITTGSAPGLLAISFSKLFGARTVWIDSIASVEHLSFSGRMAKNFADLWLTQWPHLADPIDGPNYLGSVL